MNQKILTCFSLSLIVSSLIFCAPRPDTYRNDEDKEKQTSSQQQIIMVPVTLSNPKDTLSSEEQRDRDFFNILLSIAANFGNILIDPENKPAVAQNVGNMLNGIVQAFETITKYQKRSITPDELIMILAEVLSDQTERRVRLAH